MTANEQFTKQENFMRDAYLTDLQYGTEPICIELCPTCGEEYDVKSGHTSFCCGRDEPDNATQASAATMAALRKACDRVEHARAAMRWAFENEDAIRNNAKSTHSQRVAAFRRTRTAVRAHQRAAAALAKIA